MPPGYPWAAGDALLAADLNAAIAGAGTLTVEAFGAKGDGATDDSGAFNAFADYIRASTGYQAECTISLTANRIYFIQQPINFNRFRFSRVTIAGNGSLIVGNVGATKNIISAMGSNIRFTDLRISSQGPSLSAIQIGLASTDAADDMPCYMDSVYVIGPFVNAPLYDRGAEGSTFINCYFTNQTANGYALIMDGGAHWAIDQTTITDTHPHDAPLSFNEQTFINCKFRSESTVVPSPAVWMGGAINRHDYFSCFAEVLSASPIVVYNSMFSYTDVGINGLNWQTHGEKLPSCQFFITGPYADPIIKDLQFADLFNSVQANGTVFILDTTIASCRLRNLDYRAPAHYQANVTLFDQPAKYTVTGNIEVPTAATFNPPASFSGTVLALDAMAATFNGVAVTGALTTTGQNNFNNGLAVLGTSVGTTSALQMVTAPNNNRVLGFFSGGNSATNQRWSMTVNNDTEIAGNFGADFLVERFGNTGTSLGIAMSISRGTGLATFASLAATGMTTCNGGLTFQGGGFAVGSISTDASWGCFLKGRAGSASDIALADSAGNIKFRLSTTGIGFNGTANVAKPTVTGSKGANAALASLLTALANYGLITDSTS